MCDYADFKSYENISGNLTMHITIDTLFASLSVISAESNSDPNSDIGSFMALLLLRHNFIGWLLLKEWLSWQLKEMNKAEQNSLTSSRIQGLKKHPSNFTLIQ